ncbi:MAG: hypothetical protein WD851_18975 [Pirellulales bacterium]
MQTVPTTQENLYADGRSLPRQAAKAVLVVLCLSISGGCGDGRPERIHVTGRVTFDGGDCPSDGRLIFSPGEPAPGFPMRPGIATFDTDGEFEATTWTEGDGLMPGTYRVGVECWKVEPEFQVAGVSFVPGKYMHPRTSEIQLEIAPGSDDVRIDYDFPLESSLKPDSGAPTGAVGLPR